MAQENLIQELISRNEYEKALTSLAVSPSVLAKFQYPVLFSFISEAGRQCEKASLDAIKRLLSLYATANISYEHIRDDDRDTALHHAARCNSVEVVKLLLSTGANPNIRNKKQLLPSEVCANPYGSNGAYWRGRSLEIKSELLAAEDINTIHKSFFSDNTYSPLYLAIVYTLPAAVAAQIKKGANVADIEQMGDKIDALKLCLKQVNTVGHKPTADNLEKVAAQLRR